MAERVYLICEWYDCESGGMLVYDAPKSVLKDMKEINRMLSRIEIGDVEVKFISSDITPIEGSDISQLEDKMQQAIFKEIETIKQYVGWMKCIPVRVAEGCMYFQERVHARQYENWINLIRRRRDDVMKYRRFLKSIT